MRKEPNIKEILSAFLQVKPSPEMAKKKAENNRGRKDKRRKGAKKQ